MAAKHLLALTAPIALAGALLAGCGGAQVEADDQSAATPAATEPATPAEPAATEGVAYTPNPQLNVYVQGPDPAPGDRFQPGVPDDYRAEIVVTNTGDAPVELEFAHIVFALMRDDEKVFCGEEERTDPAPGPDSLGPGEAHTYEANFHCTFPEPGEYEIRAYIGFGAYIAEGEDRERYFIGSHAVTVE